MEPEYPEERKQKKTNEKRKPKAGFFFGVIIVGIILWLGIGFFASGDAEAAFEKGKLFFQQKVVQPIKTRIEDSASAYSNIGAAREESKERGILVKKFGCFRDEIIPREKGNNRVRCAFTTEVEYSGDDEIKVKPVCEIEESEDINVPNPKEIIEGGNENIIISGETSSITDGSFKYLREEPWCELDFLVPKQDLVVAKVNGRLQFNYNRYENMYRKLVFLIDEKDFNNLDTMGKGDFFSNTGLEVRNTDTKTKYTGEPVEVAIALTPDNKQPVVVRNNDKMTLTFFLDNKWTGRVKEIRRMRLILPDNIEILPDNLGSCPFTSGRGNEYVQTNSQILKNFAPFGVKRGKENYPNIRRMDCAVSVNAYSDYNLPRDIKFGIEYIYETGSMLDTIKVKRDVIRGEDA